MADTIKVISSGLDPETGGKAITIEVRYDGKSAIILLKSGWLPSKDKDLREELEHVPSQLNQGDSLGAKDERVYRH